MHDYNITTADANTGTAMRAAINAHFAELGGEMAVALLTKGQSQGVHMTYASSGSNGIQVASGNDINLGTGNFTLVWKGSVPAWATAMSFMVKGSAGNPRFNFFQTSDKIISINIAGTAYAATLTYSAPDKTMQELVVTVKRETATASGLVRFYSNGVQLGTSLTIPAGTPLTVSGSEKLYISGDAVGAIRYASCTNAALIFNRELSAADVLDMYQIGIDPADMYGCQTPIYTSDFSAGVDGWSYWQTIIDGNIDGIGGEDNWLRTTIGANTGVHVTSKSMPNMVIGKRYKLTFKYYIPSGQSNINGLRVTGYGGSGTFYSGGALDAVATVSVEIVATAQGLYFYWTDDAEVSYQDAGGDDVGYIKDIIVIPLGAILALEPDGIQPAPGQWLDSSSNKLHAMQPAAGSSLIRPKRDFEIRWTNTWAGTHEAQYVGGVNQAILPADNIRIESITMRCTATGVNVILGDGSATSRFVASVALAAYLDCTIANRNHDGTNRKLVIDPDANFTGSITTTIKGIILD